MGRPKEDQKAAIKLAIHEHLHLNGPKGWPAVMAKFPDTSRATFFRYIKEVQNEIESAAISRGGADLALAQKRISARVSSTDQTTKKIKAHLPASPSPAVIAGMGNAAEQTFNFMAYFNQIVSDADMVRHASLKPGPDGTLVLKNPGMMDATVKRRLEIIQTWLQSMDAVWNLEKLQELYGLIIDEVGKADPVIQQNILARLRTLDDKRGITMNARF